MISSGNAIEGRRVLKILFFTALVYFSYLMLLITLQYIPLNFNAAFLQIKQDEIQLVHYQLAFFTHVYSSIFVLVLGLFQFSAFIRKRFIKFHRATGKIYVGLVLCISGPSGLIMGYYANGSWFTQSAFCILAILWIVFTFKAYSYIRRGNIQQHRNFMYRSYALTLSAVSLRLFKWIIVSLFELPPMDTYYIVAWAGWVVNLGIAEIIIFSQPGVLKR